MANLITVDYFIREINLPGNVLSGDLADITPYITMYEKQVLIDLLGYPLYKDLQAEIDADSYSTRWDRFVNGHEYTIDYAGEETTVRWNGLINDDKQSLLAYFIFYYYLKFHTTFTSNRGQLLANSENAEAHNPAQIMSNAWNLGRELYGVIDSEKIVPSAYNFLYNFEDDETDGFEGWIFTPCGHHNSFGL